MPAQRKWAVRVRVRKEAGGAGRLYQKYDLCAVHADESLILRDEGEFPGRLEKVEPKGKRPVRAFKTSRAEEGSVKLVASSRS